MFEFDKRAIYVYIKYIDKYNDSKLYILFQVISAVLNSLSQPEIVHSIIKLTWVQRISVSYVAHAYTGPLLISVNFCLSRARLCDASIKLALLRQNLIHYWSF